MNESTVLVNAQMFREELEMLRDHWDTKYEFYKGEFDDTEHQLIENKMISYGLAIDELDELEAN